MKTVVRRRLAVGALATSGALVAGLVVAPAVTARDEGLRISPSAVFNDTEQVLTFTSTDADQQFGALATFTRTTGPASTFTVQIGQQVPAANGDRTGTAEVDFTDLGDGVDADGPAAAGTYRVVIEGGENPFPVGPEGGGTDNCASCFTVLASAPLTLTSVAPTSQRPGATNAQDISLLGTGFTRGSRVDFFSGSSTTPAAGFTVTAPFGDDDTADTDDITTSTEIRRRLAIDSSVTAGQYTVRVTTPDGSTAECRNCFTVAGAPLTAISPSGGNNAPTTQRVSLTVTGGSIADGQLSLEFQDVPGSSTRAALTIPTTRQSYSSTSLTATADLSNAAPGVYQPVVRSANGVVNACDCRFTVLQNRTPTVTSLDETGTASGKAQPAGTTKTFDVRGTNFSKGAAVTVSGTGVTTTAVQFVSPTLLQATFQSTAAAATGDRNVTVTLTDGKTASCTGCYTVTAAAASPSPTASSTTSPNPSPSATATATTGFSFARLAGSERYATAARIATSSFATAETVLLANGQSDDPRTARNENHFPDALAGAYLAGNRTAPTLLTTENAVPQATLDALETLGAQNVVIIGGTSAVSQAVQDELAEDYTVTRIAGATRYDTAEAVATTPADSYVGTNPAGERTAIVANGQNFPDALVSGPLGYKSRFPILITTPNTLSSQTRDALQALDIDRVLIVGGSAAVSANTESQIRALEIETTRLSGSDKTATAVAIARYAYDTLGFDRAHVNLARGDAFPDALAGGPHGGRENAPIVLTVNSTSVGTPTLDFLESRGSSLRTGHIFGGTSAVSQAAEDSAEAAARRGSSSASPSPSASATASPTPSPTASSGGIGLPIG